MPTVQPEQWADVVDGYRWLVENDGAGHLKPVLEFACWVASGEYGRVLYPSTSHEALGLSTAPTYHERLGRPMVYVVYSEERGQFTIHWQRGQGDEVREESAVSLTAPEVFSRILAWFGVADQRQAEPGAAADGGA